MIIQHNIEIPDIPIRNENDIRVYVTPEGNLYPSITTVLSVLSEETISNWKRRVGEKTANKISSTATRRGTSLHEIVEKYLKNEPIKETVDFRAFLPSLSKITEIYCQEKTIWSDKYKIAGRSDCICVYDGKPTVIDFKTNRRKKKLEWLESYFIQGSFYAEAFEERTGTKIDDIVIMILLTDNLKVDIYEVKKNDFLDKLITVRDMFRSMYGI
jgi:genome maintenance exonuclease 1